MARITQKKRRRRARESPALLASSSESDGGSSSEDDHERRWQRRRAVHDSKGKGKELVKDEDEEESRSSESDEEQEEREEEESRLALKDIPQQVADQTCGICLSEGGNERGKLDCCEHFFCFACIMEWAKVESRCPMCKQRFLTVMRPALSGVSRSRTRSFRIPTRDQVYEPSEEEIRLFSDPYQNTVCTECQEAGDEGLLLLCDRCDAAAHTYCVGLGRSVPRGDWFCQACQLHEGDSSDEEDATFELIDGDEEDGSGTESILAMLVGDVQSNVFAGRTRRSATQGPRALRRSTRRRVRRSSLSDSPRLSEPSISTPPGPRRGFFPVLMESYAARTLSQQRQVQATVQNRLQNLRQNWNRYRSGEVDFSSAGQSIENSRPGSQGGDLPSSSTRGLGRTSRSTTAAAIDMDGRHPPSSIVTRGSSRSVEAQDADRAWANMSRAIRLEGNSAGASQSGASSRFGQLSDRRSRELDAQEVVSARTRERQGQGDMNTRANSSRIFPLERHLQGGAHSRVPRDETHSQGAISSRTRRIRGEVDFFNSHSSNSRDSDTRDSIRLDMSSREPEEYHGGILSSMCDNSRGGYNLRESSRLHTVNTGTYGRDAGAVGSSVPSSTSREGGTNTGILQLRSILDDKDNSRGSVGVLTRREAKERQNLQLPTLLDKDNSRGSVGVMTRRQEAKGAHALQAMSVLDDKDSSGGSTGRLTRREANQSRSIVYSEDRGQSLSRICSRDEEVKLMKEQCTNSVKAELDPILQKGTIDKSQYKELARSATHSILSSLGVPGLRHGTDVVSFGNVTCSHEQPTSSNLIPGCCNLCVQRHVKRYVKALVRENVSLDR